MYANMRKCFCCTWSGVRNTREFGANPMKYCGSKPLVYPFYFPYEMD